MAETSNGPHEASSRKRPQEKKIRKRRLFEFQSSFWSTSSHASGEKVVALLNDDEKFHETAVDAPDLSLLAVSDQNTCNTCNFSFVSHIELRLHVQSDHHKLNLRRKLKHKPPLNEEEFEKAVDCLSDGSLSGSELDSSDTDDDRAASRRGNSAPPASIKLQFKNPSEEEGFIIVYKVALPDETSLPSLARRGSWAVIMTGGGHFSAAIWGSDGKLLRHKSFHRYTTRRKQGGSQASADASSGGSRIKSAGANLRRYGEQALRQEVHQLLLSWQDELFRVQCVFVRASKRDKKDLLFGWEGSPLSEPYERGLCRSVPFPTRRATLKEVTRVYEELSSVVLSPYSLIVAEEPVEETKPSTKSPKPPKAQVAVSKPVLRSNVPAEKGTAHLKKRETRKPEENAGKELNAVEKLNKDFLEVINDVAENKLPEVQLRLAMSPELRTVEFGTEYFKNHHKLKTLANSYGLVGIAAASGALDVLEWLLLEQVPLGLGGSPYMATKAKKVRTFLRTFWAKHPNLHDYAAAGIPGPLTEDDLTASAEKEREKRRREKEKKKEKSFLAAEAAKSPAVRARELRAAAAEARLLGNRCVVCKKSLEGIVPFERLTYKYCSLDHCQKHREVLAKQ